MWPKSVEKSIISTLVPPAPLVWWSWWWRSHFWKQASRSLWPGCVRANTWLRTSANYSNSLSELSFFMWILSVVRCYFTGTSSHRRGVISVLPHSVSWHRQTVSSAILLKSNSFKIRGFNEQLLVSSANMSPCPVLNAYTRKWKHPSFLQDSDKSFHYTDACQCMQKAL